MSTTYEGGAAYWGRVTKQAMGKTSNGNPQLVVSFAIMGKINPADPEGELLPCPDGERTMYRPITEKTAEYVWEDIEALCAAKSIDVPDAMRRLDPERADFSCDFAGAELAWFCKHEPYNGKLHEKWQISRKTGASAGDPLDDKEMRQLDALFGKRLKDAKKPAQASPAASVPEKSKRRTAAAMAAQAPLNDGPAPWDENEAQAAPADDIPF
jgi:hypothetical protein